MSDHGSSPASQNGAAELSADDASPDFVREAYAEDPGFDLSPIARLPELLTPAPTPALGQQRLLAAVEAPPLRYAPFFDRLARLWGLSESEFLPWLAQVNDPKAWRKPPLPGLELMSIPRQGRPGEAYLARFGAGMTFPAHRHTGHEEVLLLEGSYTESSGKVYRSGDLHRMEAGSAHEFRIAADEPCVAAALHYGIEFSSVWLRILAKFFG